MKAFIYRVYAYLFAKKWLFKFNDFLFHLSLRGLGILNYNSQKLSGEEYFIKKIVKLQDKGNIVDVGSNIGSYAESFLDFGFSQKIYCFEPHPKNYRVLKERLEKYSNVAFFQNAVSDRTGTINLYDYKESDGSSHASLYQDVIEKIHKKESVEYSVPQITLDSIFYEEGNDILLLKVDTEGNELNVLIGCEKLIAADKIKIIHFEFNEMNIISRVFFKDFYDLLGNKYILYRLLPQGILPLRAYKPVSNELFAYQNIIAINKQHQDILLHY